MRASKRSASSGSLRGALGGELWNARTSTPLRADKQGAHSQGRGSDALGGAAIETKELPMFISLPVIVVLLLLLALRSIRILAVRYAARCSRSAGSPASKARACGCTAGDSAMKKLELRNGLERAGSKMDLRDNRLPVKVSAVVYFRIVDPEKGHPAGRQSLGGDQSARADHAALGVGPARNGRNAGAARQAQRRHSSKSSRQYGGQLVRPTSKPATSIWMRP